MTGVETVLAGLLAFAAAHLGLEVPPNAPIVIHTNADAGMAPEENGAYSGFGHIWLASDADSLVLVHEIAHWVQDANGKPLCEGDAYRVELAYAELVGKPVHPELRIRAKWSCDEKNA